MVIRWVILVFSYWIPLNMVVAKQNTKNGPLFFSLPQINQGYLGETKLTSFKETSPEQQYLLEKAEACSNQSQSSSNTTETSTRTDGCNSYESIGPLQSTIALDDPHSALSRPMTLLSNTESVNPQTSVPTQCSSQPTSPQIINPGTTSPQVNVNIIFSIGNGSGGTLPVIPTDLVQEDSKLPFGEKEESFSIPQQEDGKQSLMSVQESASYSAWRLTCMKDWWIHLLFLCVMIQHWKQSDWQQDALVSRHFL